MSRERGHLFLEPVMFLFWRFGSKLSQRAKFPPAQALSLIIRKRFAISSQLFTLRCPQFLRVLNVFTQASIFESLLLIFQGFFHLGLTLVYLPRLPVFFSFPAPPPVLFS